METSLAARQAQLRALIADGTVRMVWAPEVVERPAPFAGARVVADRVRGMLIGLAIGDALGNTSEGMRPYTRRAQLGEIRDYCANRYAGGASILQSPDPLQELSDSLHAAGCKQ